MSIDTVLDVASPPSRLDPLFDAVVSSPSLRGGELPAALGQRYGGDLAIPLNPDRSTLITNFVSTLDGVVSYRTPEAAGGGEISGFFEPDRFVMGLLRALADAVLIGAGTLRAAPAEVWTPDFIHPPSSEAFAELRRRLGLRPEPLTVVVSGSGEIDLAHPGLQRTEVLLVTPATGARWAMEGPIPPNIEVRRIGSERVPPTELLDLLAARGARLVLSEGGPQLFGQLLRDGLVDELFLTVAPQFAGRSATAPRLALVEGAAWGLAEAPWARLVAVRRAGDHLFTRYRLKVERTDP